MENEVGCGECPHKWKCKTRTPDIYGECRYIESGQRYQDVKKEKGELF